MFHKITEATVTIDAPKEEKISADLPVFYNPVMKFNRDVSILLLKAIDNKDMQVCDLLAGSGIRSIRFLVELPKEKIKSITINDYDETSVHLIENNIKANKGKFSNRTASIEVTNNEATSLLLKSSGFDYIDIDPFGTPNPFLDVAARRMSREGILAVTATDTSSLAGSFPKACRRKYWATPDNGPLKHESGLRILIRKVQLIAAQYDKALTPIYSYSKEHYMRIFFRCNKGKAKVDDLLKQHGKFNDAGPMWLGQLWDPKLADKIAKLAHGLDYDTDTKFLDMIKEESLIDIVGFHDLHVLCKKNKIPVPKFESLFKKIADKHKLARTHFSDYGIRSDIPEEELSRLLKSK
ncbi:MAG: tRNA (guanine(26)-N(2))-dimethyltransferase [Candidatus Woesearchaeota archaeon]